MYIITWTVCICLLLFCHVPIIRWINNGRKITWDAGADAKQNGDLQRYLYFRNRLWVSIKIPETSLEDLKDSWLHPTIFAEQNLLPPKSRMDGMLEANKHLLQSLMKARHLDPWKKFLCHTDKTSQSLSKWTFLETIPQSTVIWDGGPLISHWWWTSKQLWKQSALAWRKKTAHYRHRVSRRNSLLNHHFRLIPPFLPFSCLLLPQVVPLKGNFPPCWEVCRHLDHKGPNPTSESSLFQREWVIKGGDCHVFLLEIKQSGWCTWEADGKLGITSVFPLAVYLLV